MTDTYCCIASGPSLTQADVDYVRGKARVIVVNDNYLVAPWADYLWASDYEWWIAIPNGWKDRHLDLLSYVDFRGARCTLDLSAASEFGLHYIVSRNETGLNRQGEINHGSHSGHAAIAFAYWLGAKRIILLGYDLGGEGHWFGKHPKVRRVHPITGQEYEVDLERTTPACFETWCKEMEPLARDLREAGVEVVNCTRTTALTCFPRAALEDVL